MGVFLEQSFARRPVRLDACGAAMIMQWERLLPVTGGCDFAAGVATACLRGQCLPSPGSDFGMPTYALDCADGSGRCGN